MMGGCDGDMVEHIEPNDNAAARRGGCEIRVIRDEKMPNSTPMGMDHRHLAIWMWTHSQSLTDNSETSIESANSDGGSLLVQLGYYIIEEFCLEKFDRVPSLEEQLQLLD
ncbi:hypothetical protein OSTOST_00681 [Ostertagia ostertagi]